MTCGGGGGDDDDDDDGGGAEGDGAGSTSRSPKNPPLPPRRWVGGRGGARVEGRGSARPPAPRRGVGRNHAGRASARMDAGLLDATAATAAASEGAEGRFPPLDSCAHRRIRLIRSWRQNPPLRWLRWHTLLAPTPPGRKTTRRAGPVRCPRRARSRRTAVRSSRRSRRARLASGVVASEELRDPVATANRASETIPERTGRPSSRWAAPIGWR